MKITKLNIDKGTSIWAAIIHVGGVAMRDNRPCIAEFNGTPITGRPCTQNDFRWAK